ncbi:unnamed protein product [Sphagnum balticum]
MEILQRGKEQSDALASFIECRPDGILISVSNPAATSRTSLSKKHRRVRGSPIQACYKAGLEAAQSGDVETALSLFRDVFEGKVDARHYPQLLEATIALGPRGEELVRHHRNLVENDILSSHLSHSTLGNLTLFNNALGEPEGDLRLYRELQESDSTLAIHLCLIVILNRLKNSNRNDEQLKLSVQFVAGLAQLKNLLGSASWMLPAITANAALICFDNVYAAGDVVIASQAIRHAMLSFPKPLVIFKLRRLAETNEVARVTFEEAFDELELLDQLTFIISDCLREHDPEGLISIGAPLEEYEPEARELAPAMHQGISTGEILTRLNIIWQGKFGQVYRFGGGERDGPFEARDFVLPDLSESAKSIVSAIGRVRSRLPNK